MDRVNVILKAFDGEKYQPLLEEAFRDLKVGKCFSVTNHKNPIPKIDALQHSWIPAQPMQQGQYDHVDWSTITPLDEALVESMSTCESNTLSMMDRYAQKDDIPHAIRKRKYLEHLRYWNHMLDAENIGLYLINHVPHQCYDYVIYELCKLKGIPTYHLERCYIIDNLFVVEDYEKSHKDLVPTYEKLQKEYVDTEKHIPLSRAFDEFFEAETTRDDYPRIVGTRDKHLTKKGFVHKWIGQSMRLLWQKPLQFLQAIMSPAVWSRKLKQHQTMQYYDAHTVEPDITKPFLYVPLHMQPEESTSPTGGAFVHQELIVQLIAAHLPPDVSIYVKEHPAQGELCRSTEFYQSLLSIPSVSFVPRDFDSFTLTKHATAVATVTGTAGIEAIFRKTPVLLFGHRFFQYAPGVYPIRTNQDCKQAIDEILQSTMQYELRDIRIFLKAVEECSVPSDGNFQKSDLSKEERAVYVGKEIRRTIAPLLDV